jgi:hypothetical protein
MIDLQYYVQDKSQDKDMPEQSGILVLANREAGGRDQLDVDLEEMELEPEYGEGDDGGYEVGGSNRQILRC